MRTLLTILLAFIFIITASGQKNPQDVTTKFFEIYKLEDSDKALDYLFSNSPYAEKITEAINNVKIKIKETIQQMGAFYGADLLTTKTAGKNIIMLTYIVRHDREPLVFNFMFYKPNKEWQMQNFKYANSIDDELEESSKAYRLKENY